MKKVHEAVEMYYRYNPSCVTIIDIATCHVLYFGLVLDFLEKEISMQREHIWDADVEDYEITDEKDIYIYVNLVKKPTQIDRICKKLTLAQKDALWFCVDYDELDGLKKEVDHLVDVGIINDAECVILYGYLANYYRKEGK